MKKISSNYSIQEGNAVIYSSSSSSTMMSLPQQEQLDEIEESKRIAARKAVEDHYLDNARIVGIGSGSTIFYVVERIKEYGPQVNDKVVFIPTGYQSRELIQSFGLRVGSIDLYPKLDICFDGFDELDEKLQLIKGGGACLFQEKLIAISSAKFIAVADYRKVSTMLGENWSKGVPIEVIPLAYRYVNDKLLRLGCTGPNLRLGGVAKAGPIVTDNGNFIIDAPFGLIKRPVELLTKLKQIVGIVEVGLFVNMADQIYIGMKDGSVEIKSPHY